MAAEQRGRDAANGRFITLREMQQRKNTAVVETVKPKSKPNGGTK